MLGPAIAFSFHNSALDWAARVTSVNEGTPSFRKFNSAIRRQAGRLCPSDLRRVYAAFIALWQDWAGYKPIKMNELTLFGLIAVILMLLFYALENRSHWYTLAFAGACLLGSAYGFLQGA